MEARYPKHSPKIKPQFTTADVMVVSGIDHLRLLWGGVSEIRTRVQQSLRAYNESLELLALVDTRPCVLGPNATQKQGGMSQTAGASLIAKEPSSNGRQR